MATISENLQTLNEAKAAIKTAIENKGVDMTDVPFTQYGEKIGDMTTLTEIIKYKKSCAHIFRASPHVVDVTGFLSYNDTSEATSAESMFYACSNLERVPLFDTSKILVMDYIFYGCSKLKVVPAFDFRILKNGNNLFTNCSALEEIWVRNIKCNLPVGSGEAWGHLLTEESLIHLVRELRDTGSVLTLTVSTPSLEKLSNIYVRTIDVTDEMRAEDDLIDEKLPFEVCESTDEGAMLITNYVALKNWSIVEG